MKKVPNWIIVIVVIGLLIASKFIFFNKKEGQEKAAGGKDKAKPPVAVNYYIVSPVTFSNNVYSTGQIGALNQIDILPEIGGKVTGVFFKEGEAVNKGSVLVKLNDADLQAQLLKSKTQIGLSQQKLDRLKQLITIKGVSQEELDMQENELNSLKADQAYIEAQIEKTTIRAPFAGVLGLKNVSEGSYVTTTTPIISLVQMKPLYVEFSVPEKYDASLKKGTPVNFSVDNGSGHKQFPASIYAIEPRIDAATKTIKARALYTGSETFFPGSFVKVYIDLGETPNTIMVPTQCIVPTLKGQKVIASRNGVAEDVPVKIGVRTDEMIQVLDGLHPGDTVITTGLLLVKKDSKLKLLKSDN